MSEIIYHDLRRSAGMVPSLSAQVAREIGSRIIGGVYPNGELIEGEAALSARYQVSRSVVRDAVKILAGKGLLEARRGVGVRVRNRHHWGLLDDDILAWHQTLPPCRDFLRKLMDARAVFEPKAARRAAQRASKEDIAAINKACEAMENENGHAEQYAAADAKFHRAVLRAAQNEFLTAMEGIVYSALLTGARLTGADVRKLKTSLPLHREVADAVAAHNPDKAERAMIKLLEKANQRWGLGEQ